MGKDNRVTKSGDRVQVGQQLEVQMGIKDGWTIPMVVTSKTGRGTVWASSSGKTPQPIYYHILCDHWSIYE